MTAALVLFLALSGTTAYLDQPAPGPTASIFAPDLVSVEGRYEFAMSWSPDLSQVLFSVETPGGRAQVFHARRDQAGVWSEPAPVSLSGGARAAEMEAFFAPDGRTVYFAPYDQGMDVRPWQVTLTDDGWCDPAPLAGDPAQDPAFFPTCAADGTIYYSNLAKRTVDRARLGDDGTWHAEPAGLSHGGHPFIAPDQSFVLLDSAADDSLGKRDIYVAFATADGGWSEPVNLGPTVNSGYSETCPSLSPDGRYLFFSRYNEPGDVSQIYWVGAGVIETAREAVEAAN